MEDQDTEYLVFSRIQKRDSDIGAIIAHYSRAVLPGAGKGLSHATCRTAGGVSIGSSDAGAHVLLEAIEYLAKTLRHRVMLTGTCDGSRSQSPTP